MAGEPTSYLARNSLNGGGGLLFLHSAFRIGGLMPTYKYEALDTSGAEVKDSVEASNEEEAQQKVKAMGYFVTKLTAVAGAKSKTKKKKAGKSRKTFVI